MSEETREFSLINYEKSLKIAQKMNLYASHATAFSTVVNGFGSIFGNNLIDQKKLLSGGMKIGLTAIQGISGTKRAANFIN